MTRVYWEVHHLPTHNLIADFLTLREAREFVRRQGHPLSDFSILRCQGESVRRVAA